MNEMQTQFLPLKGMRALVTGGAQGIGAGICAGLAAAGAEVAVVDRQADKARNLAADIISKGGFACAVPADIATADGCRRALEDSITVLGGLDILVNCAAPNRNRNMLGKLADTDWDIHQQVVLNSAVILADAATDYLASRGCGVVINISSITGVSIALDQCSWPYHVSKAGLDQLTRWLAVRLGRQGIRVNAIAPGLVDRDTGQKLTDTPQNSAVIKEIVPLGRAGSSHDVAQAVVFLSSKQSAYITGQVLVVDGGLSVNEVFGASLKAFKAGMETSP